MHATGILTGGIWATRLWSLVGGDSVGGTNDKEEWTPLKSREKRKKNKKTIKKRGKSAQETKSKKTKFFSHLVTLCLDPPAFPKGPWGCPLDQRSVQINAIHRAPDRLPIHIGSWSNIKLAQVTKKRVLQRVLRYYGGSTGPRCAHRVRIRLWLYLVFI